MPLTAVTETFQATFHNILVICKEEFEDTKGVIRIGKSKDRQQNEQKN